MYIFIRNDAYVHNVDNFTPASINITGIYNAALPAYALILVLWSRLHM